MQSIHDQPQLFDNATGVDMSPTIMHICPLPRPTRWLCAAYNEAASITDSNAGEEPRGTFQKVAGTCTAMSDPAMSIRIAS